MRFLHKGLISTKEAAANLGISRRQVERLFQRLSARDWNPNAILPVSHKAWNRIGQPIREQVILLHRQRPERSNPAIQELLREDGICLSAATIRRIRVEAGLYKEVQIEKRSFKKFEAKRFGDLLQMDTTMGYWLQGGLIKLICIIDDHSRAILAFRWVAHDTAWENMRLIREVIENYGVPAVLYTDNDSKFRTIRHKRSRYHNYRDEDYETQIARACREAGTALVNHPPYQAFCKGKVERLFQFIQGRFLPEMKAENFRELNGQFARWVSWYNTRHRNRMTGCPPKERMEPLGFQPLSGKVDLDYVFSLREERKLDKYTSFSFHGTRYFLDCKEMFPGMKVTLACNPDHKIKVYYDNKFIQEFIIN